MQKPSVLAVFPRASRRGSASLLHALLGVSLLAGGCFDPEPQPGTDLDTDSSEGSTSATTLTGTTMPSTTGDPTTGDPTTDSATTGDPTTGDPTTDPTTGDPTTDSTDTATTGSDTDATTGSASCDGGSCAPEVPDGWSGPVVMQLAAGDGTLADCPAAYPTLVDDLFLGLSVDETTCGCSCGSVTGVSCPSTAILSERNNCIQLTFNPETQVVGNSCVRVNTPVNWEAFTTNANPNLSAAGCTATATESFPDPAWDNRVRTCSGTTGGSCEDGGECVDAGGDFGDICVYQDGDVECPADYPDKHLGRDGVSDTRDCDDTCQCNNPQATCAGAVTFHSESDDIGTPGCGSAVQATRTVGQCATSPSVSNPSARYTPAGFVSQGCTPTEPAPTGDLSPTGATTVCCMGG